MTDLTSALKAIGRDGYTMTTQGPGRFLAISVRGGVNCDPRNYDTHPTAEAAEADLLRKVTEADDVDRQAWDAQMRRVCK